MSKAASPCSVPGCPSLRPCATHDTAAGNRRREDGRASAARRGYGRRWKRLRDMYLRRNPLCVECARQGLTVAATDVDHITPKRNGGRDEWSNLQSLCHACHSRKTARGG